MLEQNPIYQGLPEEPTSPTLEQLTELARKKALADRAPQGGPINNLLKAVGLGPRERPPLPPATVRDGDSTMLSAVPQVWADADPRQKLLGVNSEIGDRARDPEAWKGNVASDEYLQTKRAGLLSQGQELQTEIGRQDAARKLGEESDAAELAELKARLTPEQEQAWEKERMRLEHGYRIDEIDRSKRGEKPPGDWLKLMPEKKYLFARNQLVREGKPSGEADIQNFIRMMDTIAGGGSNEQAGPAAPGGQPAAASGQPSMTPVAPPRPAQPVMLQSSAPSFQSPGTSGGQGALGAKVNNILEPLAHRLLRRNRQGR